MSVLRSDLPTVTPLFSFPSAFVWTQTPVSVEPHSPKTSSTCLTLVAVEIEFEMRLSSTASDGPNPMGSAEKQASLLLECERLVSSSSLGEEEGEQAPQLSSLAEEVASVPLAAPSPSDTAETLLLTGDATLPADVEERSVEKLVEVEVEADLEGQVARQG